MQHKVINCLFLFLMVVVVGLNCCWMWTGLKGSMVGETDAYSRLFLLKKYSETGGIGKPWVDLPLGSVWLSGYFSIILIFDVFKIGEISYRVTTYLFGFLTIGLVVLLYRKIFGKRFVGWRVLAIVGWLLSTAPFYREVVGQTLSEPLLGFWLLLSIYLLINRRWRWSLITLIVAQTIRYEAWFVIPFYWIYILWKSGMGRWRKGALMFGTVVFPLMWIIIGYIQVGNGLIFFRNKYQTAQNVVLPEYGNIFLSSKIWIDKSIGYVGKVWMGWWLAGAVAIVISRKKELLWYLGLNIFTLMVLVVQVFFGTMEWFPSRLLYLFYVLSIPIMMWVGSMMINYLWIKNNLITKFFGVIVFVVMVRAYILSMSASGVKVNDYFYNNRMIFEMSEQINNFDKKIKSGKISFWFYNLPWLLVDAEYHFKNLGFNEMTRVENVENINLRNNDLLIVESSDEVFRVLSDKGLVEVLNKSPFGVWKINEERN